MIKLLTLFLLTISLSGCANFGKKLKSFLRGEDASKQMAEQKPATSYGTKFSENQNYLNGPRRQYKRTTRSKLESDSQLADSSGSLWIMEGQGAYLFSQNIMRMIGDPLAIRIDGEPKEQLESKVKIIVDLLNLLSAKRKAQARRVAAENAAKAKKDSAAKKADSNQKNQQTASSPNSKDEEKPEYESAFPVKTVPTRIVERLVDGNYRIKGSQPFMIGKREYKVIVTGIVRAEDFSEDGINSTKLLDPKFDIVSKKRRETL